MGRREYGKREVLVIIKVWSRGNKGRRCIAIRSSSGARLRYAFGIGLLTWNMNFCHGRGAANQRYDSSVCKVCSGTVPPLARLYISIRDP